jgi:predicted MFS family arabinose efflux permease
MCTDSSAVMSDDSPATRWATRLSFLAAGFAMACWAPLVPYAKARLGLNEGMLGLLLLSLGAGSMAAMPLAGALVGRWGARAVIMVAGAGLCLSLPMLALLGTPMALSLALLLFGASLGSMDVAMNVHAVAVERAAGQPLMSGFHGLFSVGGLAGAAIMTVLLAAGIAPLSAAVAAAVAVLAAVALAGPRLLATQAGGDGPLFVRPHGIVMLLGVLAFAAFLMEGAILDWAALFLTQVRGVDTAEGGAGYVLFSLAMTAGRLGGDRIVARLGRENVLRWGGLLVAAGFVLMVALPQAGAALAGLLLVGLGASNLVPILFSAAGKQHAMPIGLAVAAVTTVGYAGILVGPALIGFVAQALGLSAAFLMLGGLILAMPLAARRVVK